MGIARNPSKLIDFVVAEERGSANPTTFSLRPVQRGLLIEVENMVMGKLQGMPLGTLRNRVLKECLRGWKGLMDESGAEVPFQAQPDGRISDDCLEKIFPDWGYQMFDFLLAEAKLTGAEKKGSV